MRVFKRLRAHLCGRLCRHIGPWTFLSGSARPDYDLPTSCSGTWQRGACGY